MDFKKKIWGYRENQAVVRKTFGDLIEVFYHTFILSKKFFAKYHQFPGIARRPGVVRASSNHYYRQAVPGNSWLSEVPLVFPSKTYHKRILEKYFGCQKTSCRRSANDYNLGPHRAPECNYSSSSSSNLFYMGYSCCQHSKWAYINPWQKGDVAEN